MKEAPQQRPEAPPALRVAATARRPGWGEWTAAGPELLPAFALSDMQSHCRAFSQKSGMTGLTFERAVESVLRIDPEGGTSIEAERPLRRLQSRLKVMVAQPRDMVDNDGENWMYFKQSILTDELAHLTKKRGV